MSDRELRAQITATDKASPVFRQVADGAQKMGTSVEQAGQKGGRSLDDLSKRGAAFGAVLTAGAGLLANWNRSAQDAAAVQRGLEASIAATGDAYAQYADRIDEVGRRAVQLGMDDEAASQAISALTQVTGSANVALENMGLVMDLAAAKHLSLESAAELVGKVLEGNVGILNRAGFAIDENATATEALAQVQQAVAGQAEAQATTYARLREEFSNLTDSVGAAVGGFAPLLSLLPGVSSGFTLAGATIGAIAPELTLAGAATTAFGLALGPVGLVAAAAAAGVGISLLMGELKDFEFEAKVAASAAEDLENFYASLAQVVDEDTAKALRAVIDHFKEVSALALGNEGLANALEVTRAQLDALGGSANLNAGVFRHLTDAQKAAIDTNHDQMISLDELDAAQQRVAHSMQLTDDQVTAIDAALKSLFSHSNLDAQKAQAAFDDLLTRFAQGKIDGAELQRQVEAMASGWYQYAEAAGKAATATAAVNQAWDASLNRAVALAAAQGDAAFSLIGYYNASLDAADGTASLTALAQAQRDAAAAAATATDDNAFSLGNLFEASKTAVSVSDSLVTAWHSQETALDRVARGSTSAGVALRAFKDAQDAIIASQDPFNQQLSEYGQQLDYLQNAEDLLNQRKADGIALSADEEDFLNRVDAAQERVQGGREDATIALGEQALAYAENMSKGDALNSSLDGVSRTTGELTDAIRDLILSLDGIPEDVKTQITLDGADEAIAGAYSLSQALNSIPTVVNSTVTTTKQTVVIGEPGAGRLGGVAEHLMVPSYAAGGVVARLAEVGPEAVVSRGRTSYAMADGLYALSAGAYVRNTAATTAMGGRGGVVLQFGDVHLSGFSDVDTFFSAAAQAARAHFAGMGV